MSAVEEILSTNPLIQLAIIGSIVGVIGFIITQIRDFNRKTKQMEENIKTRQIIRDKKLEENMDLLDISESNREYIRQIMGYNMENLRRHQQRMEEHSNSFIKSEIETKDLTPLSDQLEKLKKNDTIN